MYILSLMPRIETGNQQVGRRTDKGTDSSHPRSIAQRYQQFGGSDVQLLGPDFYHLDENGYHGRVAQERT